MRLHKITMLGLLVMIGLSVSVLAIERSDGKAADTSVVLAQADPDTSKSQMDRPDKPMRRGPFGRGGEFGHGPEKFERLRLRKMIELLELEGDKKDAFVTIARKYRDRKFEFMRTHMATVDSLGSGIRSGSLDDKEIERLVNRLDKMEEDMGKMRQEFRHEVRPLLNAEQYGKLVVFEYRFEAKIFDRINEMRGRRGGPPPDMPPPPEDMDSSFDDDSF